MGVCKLPLASGHDGTITGNTLVTQRYRRDTRVRQFKPSRFCHVVAFHTLAFTRIARQTRFLHKRPDEPLGIVVKDHKVAGPQKSRRHTVEQAEKSVTETFHTAARHPHAIPQDNHFLREYPA